MIQVVLWSQLNKAHNQVCHVVVWAAKKAQSAACMASSRSQPAELFQMVRPLLKKLLLFWSFGVARRQQEPWRRSWGWPGRWGVLRWPNKLPTGLLGPTRSQVVPVVEPWSLGSNTVQQQAALSQEWSVSKILTKGTKGLIVNYLTYWNYLLYWLENEKGVYSGNGCCLAWE